MKVNYIIFFTIVLFFGCKNAASNFHNGTYVYSDKSIKNLKEESIIIDGSYATLYLRSLMNRSKLKKSIFLCIQYSNRIDLQMRRQPPLVIEVDKNGNLIIGEKIFKKQSETPILNIPIPKAFQEN